MATKYVYMFSCGGQSIHLLMPLCCLCQIKHWAKAHDVNSALRNTLNSISITLLVAHHLQVATLCWITTSHSPFFHFLFFYLLC